MLDPDSVGQIRDISGRANMAYKIIRTAIASGRIAPGEWLRQEALAQELGVSQVTIREALSRLRAEGLVVHEPYKGVKALVLPRDEQQDILEIRAALEGLAMEVAAKQITDADLARMRELLPKTIVTEDPESAESAWEANRAFHWIAIRASGRSHLMRLLDQIWDFTNHYLLLSRLEPERRVEIAQDDLREHQQLLAALAARDGGGARKVIVDALGRALAMAQGVINGQGEDESSEPNQP